MASRLPSLVNALLAVLSAALCFVDSGPLRWLAGTSLALALPGDAVRRALNVARRDIPAVVFTLSTSLAITVFVGLAVDQLSPGITARTMAVGLLAVAVAADAAALRPLPDAAGPSAAEHAAAAPRAEKVRAPDQLTWKHYAACAALFAIPAGMGVTLAVRASERHDRSEAGAALSIVRQNGNVVVEVIQAAPGSHSYVLDVESGGTVLLARTVRFATGSAVSVPIDVSHVPAFTRVTAELIPVGTTAPLRSVWLVKGQS